MTVKTVLYNSLGPDVSRGPSNIIWKNFDVPGLVEAGGMYFFDDFLLFGAPVLNSAVSQMGQWACWADTGSTFTDAGAEGGIIKLLNTSSPKNITLASATGSFRMVSGATNYPLGQKLAFEARLARGSITTGHQDIFIGLADNTTAQLNSSGTVVLSAANTLGTGPNLFGFHFRDSTNPTDVGVAFNVAGGTVQYPTGLQTLSNTVTGAALTAYAAVSNGNPTGFVKVGFVFDPEADNEAVAIQTASSGQTVGVIAKPLIRFYVNGTLCGTFLTSTNLQAATFPTGWMAPVIAFQTVTSSDFCYIDWIRVAQGASY